MSETVYGKPPHGPAREDSHDRGELNAMPQAEAEASRGLAVR
jgi:hypothetical protein